MKIECFHTLDAVLRGGSFAAAASAMNLSPSAVSLQMKQLETHLGQALFDRSALQVRPTALAHEVNALFKDPLGRLAVLRQRHTPAVEGALRLGIIEPLQVTLLPALLLRVRAHYPQLDVRPVRGRVADLTEQLRGGQLDAAVVVRPEHGGSSRLAWTPLYRETLVAIAPPDARETRLDELFAKHEWIRFDKTTVGGRLAARVVAEHAPHARCRIDLQSLAAITALVSAGLGASILPEIGPNLMNVHPVRVLSLGKRAPYRQIALVCRRADQDLRTIEALKACLLQVGRPA
ncbi:LysR family transcriptional regulator [Pseudomonadota bacterium AL_CKDN230030165-1A_HGKHYDSX7]